VSIAPYITINRELIWLALFARLKASLGSQAVTVGRRHIQPPTLTPELQPAVFLVQVRETHAPNPKGTPGKLTLSGFIIVYLQAPAVLLDDIGAETVVGATPLNALLQAVDQAMLPDDVLSGRNTLGGLVDHCWLEGDTDMDDGIYSQQAAAILPVKIMVP
jgi:hypothetical protein